MIKKAIITISSVILFMFSLPASGQFYFFGDSLSDGGVMDNNNQLPAQYNQVNRKPIYTNPSYEGYGTWPYHLSETFGQLANYGPNNESSGIGNDGSSVSGKLSGNNYAAGGAVTKGAGIAFSNYSPPSLVTQVERFSKQHADDKNLDQNIYFIWVGSNDYMRQLMSTLANPNNVLGTIIEDLIAVNQNGPETIAQQIEALHQLGTDGDHPKKFYVILLPKISGTPITQSILKQIPLFDNPLIKGVINSLSQAFNKNLLTQVDKLKAKYGNEIEITTFDPNTSLDQITNTIDGGQAYHYQTKYLSQQHDIVLTDDKNGACTSTSSPDKITSQAIACKTFAENSDNKVYADIIHPSAVVHLILADKIAEDLINKHWMSK